MGIGEDDRAAITMKYCEHPKSPHAPRVDIVQSKRTPRLAESPGQARGPGCRRQGLGKAPGFFPPAGAENKSLVFSRVPGW
tara:strand:+ start:306 stop:548 length:243 start_codon:yes stop_codon:yes gene_type:complete